MNCRVYALSQRHKAVLYGAASIILVQWGLMLYAMSQSLKGTANVAVLLGVPTFPFPPIPKVDAYHGTYALTGVFLRQANSNDVSKSVHLHIRPGGVSPLAPIVSQAQLTKKYAQATFRWSLVVFDAGVWYVGFPINHYHHLPKDEEVRVHTLGQCYSEGRYNLLLCPLFFQSSMAHFVVACSGKFPRYVPSLRHDFSDILNSH